MMEAPDLQQQQETATPTMDDLLLQMFQSIKQRKTSEFKTHIQEAVSLFSRDEVLNMINGLESSGDVIGTCGNDVISRNLVLQMAKANDVESLQILVSSLENSAENDDEESPVHFLNVNVRDNQGLTPLHFAIRHKNLEMVRLLVSLEGCDADIRDNLLDQTPVHELFAGWLSKSHRVAFAANRKAPPSSSLAAEDQSEVAEDDQSKSLNSTEERMQEEVMEVLELLLPHCDMNALCRTNQESFVHRLASRPDDFSRSVFEWLVQNCPDLNVNLQNGCGESPLMVALEFTNLEMAKLLLRSGADLFIVNKFRETALHITARKNQVEILEMMLTSRVCPVTFKDFDGNTAVHLAASRGFVRAVKLLLQQGANSPLNMPNVMGETPLHLAVEGGFTEIIKMLVSHESCNLEARTAEDCDVLEIAGWNRRESLQCQIIDILTSAINCRHRRSMQLTLPTSTTMASSSSSIHDVVGRRQSLQLTLSSSCGSCSEEGGGVEDGAAGRSSSKSSVSFGDFSDGLG